MLGEDAISALESAVSVIAVEQDPCGPWGKNHTANLSGETGQCLLRNTVLCMALLPSE